MKKKIKYTNEQFAMGERVKDFLPPPSELLKRERTSKITLELTQGSIDFFKKQAKRGRIPYKRMLGTLIETYVKQHGSV